MEGKRTEGETRGARRIWPLLVGLPLIAVVAVAAVVFAGGGEGGSGPAGRQAERPSGGGGQTSELGHPALGRGDAPVVMIEYGDYG